MKRASVHRFAKFKKRNFRALVFDASTVVTWPLASRECYATMLAKCVPRIPGTSFRVNVFGMIKATQEREVNMLFDASEAHQKDSHRVRASEWEKTSAIRMGCFRILRFIFIFRRNKKNVDVIREYTVVHLTIHSYSERWAAVELYTQIHLN